MSTRRALLLRRATEAAPLDSFSDARQLGKVIGAFSPAGAIRQGADVESKLSANNGNLRIAAPTTAGWARAGVVYGPYGRQAGLAFVIRLIDGDTQSTSGGDSKHLAAGWFASAAPSDASNDGNAFVLAEASTSSGRMNIGASTVIPVLQVFKQVEMYLIVVLAAIGARYYIGSVNGARELPGYPNVRPIWINASKTDALVYAGLYQRFLSSGANNNTRVSALAVAMISGWSNWYGSASGADTLIGSGAIASHTADTGQAWTTSSGGITLDANGATPSSSGISSLATTHTHGMSKMTVVTGSGTLNYAILCFRFQDTSNYWWFGANGANITLRKVIAAAETTVVSTGVLHLNASSTHTMVVIDDGTRIRCYFDGGEPGVNGTSDTALASATKIGLRFTAGSLDLRVTNLESHARAIPLPPALDLGAPYERLGGTTVATDDLTGGAGDMAGSTTTTGSLTWTRSLGTKVFSRSGAGGGAVNGTVSTTIYTVPWSSPDFADLSLDVLPDGASYGLGKTCRTGVVFYQDSSNYLAARAFVDDGQTNSAEIEIEYMKAGAALVVERTNWATDINHGVTTTIRMTFDGMNFVCYRTGEPSVCRALTDIDASYTPMAILAVGIYSGSSDTGSTFDSFVAKSA